jgi:indole-3-glycerol phosphate synthase
MPNEYTRTHPEAQERNGVSLSTILAVTRNGLDGLRQRRREVEAAALAAPAAPAWSQAFGTSDVSVIAEIKRRSPSAGDIAPSLDPAGHARAYELGGARAISVLTEGPHFGGSVADLLAVRHAVGLPVLRKDFIIDPVQVFEARAAGASAILLIARALSRETAVGLARLANGLGLGVMVEVHRAEELDAALACEPDALGVNSRDLETFRVDVAGMESLLRRVPPGMIAVAESGLASREDVERVAEWGADAVLMGTALASTAEPERQVRAMVGCPRKPAARRGR